jgi:hypothetical protein
MYDSPIDDALNVVDLCAQYIDKIIAQEPVSRYDFLGISQNPKDAIDELNYRLRSDGVGFEYTNGELIRVDSRFMHEQVIKAALVLLSDNRFQGPEQEFMESFKSYREGNYKDAITGANRAFESAMKCICQMKNWSYHKGARAVDLLRVLKSNGLFPDYLDASFDQLLAILSSGLPQIRNNSGGHGQGPVPVSVPRYVVSFALHMAAAKMVFLVDAARDK